MKKHIKNSGHKNYKADLYGYHAVREAWLNPARDIQALYLSDNAKSGFQETLTQARKSGLKRPPPITLPKDAFDNMFTRGAVHQGIALKAAPLEEIYLQDLLIQSKNQEKTVFVILDQVTDPHNIGAIMRSSCAFGATGIIMQRKHAPALDGTLAKTACGTLEHIPVIYETNLARAIETCQQDGFFVFGLDERGEASIDTYQFPEKTILVFGAEGPGLRRLIKEKCDALLKLPTKGAISSLNVSNAVAVTLYATLT